MKKIVTFLILFIIVPLSIFFLSGKVETEAGTASRDSVEKAYAYKISIVRYDGSGNAEVLPGSKPILIYHPDMMGEPTLNTGGALPSSHDDIMNNPGAYNMEQIWNPNSDGFHAHGIFSDDSESYYNSETSESHPMGAVMNPYLANYSNPDGSSSNDKTVKFNSKLEQIKTPACDGSCHPTRDGLSCFPKTIVYTFSYMSDNRTTTYKNNLIDNIGDFNRIYEDSALTQTNVENGVFLERIKKVYLGKPRNEIEDMFDVSLRDMDMDKYYYRIEVMHRSLIEKFDDIGTKEFRRIDQNPMYNEAEQKYSDGWLSYNNDEDFCTNNSKPEGLKVTKMDKTECRNETTYSGCMPATSCTNMNGTPNYRVYCGGRAYVYCTVVSCPGGKEQKCLYYGACYPESTSLDGFYNGEMQRHIILGHISNGHSEIVRATGTGFDERAANKCESDDAKHCVLDDAGNCTNEYKYYVGPNIDKALVGPDSSYHYQLVGGCSSGTYAGVMHIFYTDLEINTCTKSCENSGSHTSDSYLSCAENYCEARVDYDLKGSPRERKKNCLINKCEYSYGRSPSNGSSTSSDRESIDSCNNSVRDGIASKYVNKIFSEKSNCNVVNGKYVPEYEGVYVHPCDGDYVTDFDGRANEKPDWFDGRTYINKICKEITKFEFKDTSKLKLGQGGGFTYPIIQYGEQECTYFINKEQWKFDYASAPARDPDKRKRLRYILDVFNGLVSNYDVTSSDNYDSRFAGLGEIKTYENGYNFSKTEIDLNGKEYLTTDLKTDDLTGSYVIGKTSAETENIAAKENRTNSSLVTTAKESVTIIEDGNIGSRGINRYVSVGEGTQKYTLSKVCISTDGLATVYDAPASEECHETEIGEKQGDTIKKDKISILAESKYYTNFQIDSKKENEIGTTVYVGKTAATKHDGETYYKDEEKCTYKADNNGKLCVLKIEPVNGTKLGNGQYEAEKLKVTIHYNIKQSEINSVSIVDNGQETYAEEIIASRKGEKYVTEHKFEGKIYLKDGSVATCPEIVDHYDPGSHCGVGCRINRLDSDLYEIESTGSRSVTNYYTYTSNHMISGYDELINTGYTPYSFMEKVIGSVKDNRNYIKLHKALDKDEILFGYVTASDQSCNNYCKYSTNNSACPEGLLYCPKETPGDCYTRYKATQTLKINEYCKRSWTTDLNGFVDEEDCFTKCSWVCPNNRQDKDAIDIYCNNYAAYGFTEKKYCMNLCYTPEEEPSGDDYIFRSVNVNNPFPNSSESKPPYDTGKRIVGKNWKFLSEYITDDDGDETTVTGVNANKHVEYVIELGKEDIKAIRNDTNSLGNGNTTKNRRRVYGKLDRIKTGDKKVIQEYKSQFIHNSQFTEYFRQNHGDNKEIDAVFYPGNNQ